MVAGHLFDASRRDVAVPSLWPRRKPTCLTAAVLCLVLAGSPARAENPAAGSPLHDPLPEPLAAPYSIAPIDPGLSEFKSALLALGYNFQINYTNEVAVNPVGGAQQSAIYEGLLELGVDADLDRIMNWKGASFHVNAFQIHGHGLTTYNIFNYSTISSIEARATTRLFEAWFEQELFGGFASIRLGQLAADSEFLNSDFDALYWNGTFGWPNFTSNNLPGTGPGYPLTTPGIRVKIVPDDHTTFLFAVFNGDPAGSGLDSARAQIDNCCGINFRLRDPPLLFGQAEFENIPADGSQDLAGKLRIGSWYHFGPFADYFLATNGRPLADPRSTGQALVHSGDVGVYAILDQMLWRAPGDNPWRGIGAFVQVMAAPPDRNLLSLEIQAGVNFMGLWDARPSDIFGAAFSYSRVSPALGANQRVAQFFDDDAALVQSYEIAFELTYQVQIVQGFIVQPDFQYIFRPGGGTRDPLHAAVGRIPDAAVFGLRTGFKF